MTTHTVGEFKARFSTILDHIRRGEMVGVCYGKAKKPVAVLVPIDKAPQVGARKIGVLAGKASFRVKPGFKMTDAELLGL
jgi:antitoxin (DNA-binding transcriptional repressor) of toxin-antitoxin stability system